MNKLFLVLSVVCLFASSYSQEEVVAVVPEGELDNAALVEAVVAAVEAEWAGAEVTVVESANVATLVQSGEDVVVASVEEWNWNGEDVNVELEWQN